jgi:hypothetical protein
MRHARQQPSGVEIAVLTKITRSEIQSRKLPRLSTRAGPAVASGNGDRCNPQKAPVAEQNCGSTLKRTSEPRVKTMRERMSDNRGLKRHKSDLSFFEYSFILLYVICTDTRHGGRRKITPLL